MVFDLACTSMIDYSKGIQWEKCHKSSKMFTFSTYICSSISISVLVPILWKDYIYSPRCLDSETTFKLFIQIFICISMRCPCFSLILLWHNWVKKYFTNNLIIWLISHISGSLPPSPADSGVSDVDPSSSSQTSDEESKIHSRLQIHGKIGVSSR